MLLVLAGVAMGVATWPRQAHRKSQAPDAANVAAIAVAKDCVAATQPPDLAGLPAAQQELERRAHRDFGNQTAWYGEVLGGGVSGGRTSACECPRFTQRWNATTKTARSSRWWSFRATVSQTGMADRENSYRMRVRMVLDNGQFKVAQLDQVAK